tara:strand:+ start:1376 stop:1552 length:177 start_codon:yes stop_codon:yes gene_type:complete
LIEKANYTPYFYVVGFLFITIAVMIFTSLNFELATNQSILAGLVTATIVVIIVRKINS